MIPDKIYTFQDDEDRYWYKPEEWETPPLTKVEYIRKDTLLEWLRKEADKSYNSFAREELGLEARHRGLDFEEVIRKIKSL